MGGRMRNEAGIAAAIGRLVERFGERLSTSASLREQHGHTLTWIANQPPDAVVFARSEAEVQEIVRICAAEGCPVVPFGAGTSLEGHLNAPYGGVSIDVSAMDAIVAVHPEDLDVVVQPGIRRKALNEQLRDTGLFFPIDPGADATLGGMAATRASGTNAVRYGTMKDTVLSIRAVTASGEIVTTSRRAKKSSTGYDLTRLFVGSEGTLGVITELTIRLSGIPEAIAGGICPFPSVQAAADAVILTIQTGIPVARIELLDEVQVKACNLYSKLDLPETPLLLLEFHGTDAWVAEQSTRFGEIAADLGGGPFTWTTKAEERTKLWTARHDAYWAGLALRPGCQTFSTDVCVPISRLAECIAETKADIEADGLVAPIVGHVGDGNFHVLPLFHPDDTSEIDKVKRFVGRLVERALAMEGTASGEHGVGQGKMKYLEAEHGRAALDAMAAIKQALDPKGIMNPGKIVAS
ncbi:MAG: FAD-binding protein [Hyphomicrobiales bacterium]|nr:FAD-binding protein [Hyphomicrobiales bacterium]